MGHSGDNSVSSILLDNDVSDTVKPFVLRIHGLCNRTVSMSLALAIDRLQKDGKTFTLTNAFQVL